MYMSKNINKVVKIMILSDLFLSAGWGLINPILAVYIITDIQGGDVEAAGIAVGIYWLLKSILQVPVARYLDKNHGEKDDFLFMFVGRIFSSVISPIIFIFSVYPWHIYFAQVIHALGAAMVVPAWSAIFTRHIDDGQEAFSWSLDSSSIGLGSGIAGLLGGVIAKFFGFVPLFIILAIFGLFSAVLFIMIKKDMLPKTPREKVYPLPKHL